MKPAAIECEIDHGRRVVITRYVGVVTGDMAQTELPRLWARHKEVLSYNSLVDATAFTGAIGHGDIRAIAALWRDFCGGTIPAKRSAIVSRDEMIAMSAKAIFTEFPEHRYAVFTSRAEALDWLTENSD